MLRILRIFVGIILVIFGLFALLTPLTPGAWVGLIGLEMLGFGFLIPKKIRRLWHKDSGAHTNALIIHGIGGDPSENWFPWLKTKLESLSVKVTVPHFPNADRLSFEDWWKVLEEHENVFQKPCIVIGHSLGAGFLLSVLERYPAHAAFFVAPAWGKTHNAFTPAMASIIDRPFDWEAISKHCKNFCIFHSDDDPYLPLERAETLSKYLDCPLTVIPGGGHFNTAAGYTAFPKLLEEIKKVINV